MRFMVDVCAGRSEGMGSAELSQAHGELGAGKNGKRIEAHSTTGIGAMDMFLKIREVSYISDYLLLITYSDSQKRIVDIEPLLRNKKGEKAQQLLAVDYFKKVRISEAGETIEWENGYDICPDILYEIWTLDRRRPDALKNTRSREKIIGLVNRIPEEDLGDPEELLKSYLAQRDSLIIIEPFDRSKARVEFLTDLDEAKKDAQLGEVISHEEMRREIYGE
jgi:hypothetical protein